MMLKRVSDAIGSGCLVHDMHTHKPTANGPPTAIMSAVFEAAAMSLLSRTLTTALGKYLSNVDVEGLDWGGIRISKVELKAAKLMTLPGKPTNRQAGSDKDESSEDTSLQLEGLNDDSARPPLVIETTAPAVTARIPAAEDDASSSNHNERRSWFSSWYSKNDDPLMDQSERPAPAAAKPRDTSTITSYSLELCEGGRLGILDVRLVGKALQVLVEDADITLRIVSTSGSATAANTSDKPTKPPHKNEPTTVGDRVLAENVLAKVLSGIPNLLLRDIRVKLILDETSTVELTIGLLSVTDGSIDVLAQFGMDDTDEVDPEEEASSSDDESETMSSLTENQFLTKRIRTGRGDEGGIVIRVLVPHEKLPDGEACWSRHAWYSTVPDGCLLRLSGLDLQGKIFLGSAAEVAKLNKYYNETEVVVDVDELLFSGVDAIAPGPIPSLPPPPDIAEPLADDRPPAIIANYNTDQNGIQSCKLCSNFHRVARGLVPKACQCDQAPNDCECWTDDRFAEQEENRHILDDSLPMAGLVLNINIRDPLEMNVDRSSLETLGTLIACFTKPTEQNASHEDVDESVDLATTTHPDDLELMPSESMRSRRSVATQHTGDRRPTARRHMSTDSLRTARRHRRPAPPKTFRDHDTEHGFPSYMQPEKIQFIGVCVSHIRLRVHVMRPTELGDTGTSFCYWDCTVQKLAVDYQALSAPERPFQDVRASLGVFRVVEFKGVHRSQTILLGNDGTQNRDEDESTAATTATSQMDCDPLWPSTAAVMCNSQVLFEPLPPGVAAIQARYLSVRNPHSHFDHDHKSAVAHFGRTSVDASFSIKDEIPTLTTEARRSILPHAAKSETISECKDQRRLSSLLFYKATIQRGNLCLHPMIEASIPRLTVNGEISSENGFSLETLLAGIDIKHGIKSRPRFLARGITLQQLADLPETVRLRVLLFIHDLQPLENALGLKPARNSFLQCRAVNNGIVEYVKTLRDKQQYVESQPTTQPRASERRQDLLNELMQLDDEELEALLASRRGLYML